MNKRFISCLLCLVFVFSSFSCFADSNQTKTIAPSSAVALCGDGRRFENQVIACAHSTNPGGRFVSFFKLDLSEYLPYIYAAQSISLSIRSVTLSSQGGSGVTFSFLPDSIEDYDATDITYSKASAAGMLNEAQSFYTIESHTQNTLYTTSNIKTKLIEALAGGINNTVTVRCMGTNNNRVDFVMDSLEIKIDFPSGNINSTHLNAVKDEFNIETLEGVSSGEVNENFILPAFYRGAEVFWISNNDAIKIDKDDNTKAIVTRPVGTNTPVNLKAIFTDSGFKSFLPRDFSLSVLALGAMENAEQSFSTDVSMIFSDGDSARSVTKDLNLFDTYKSVKVSWESSDNNIINSQTGKLVPSTVEDKTVVLTPTISHGGNSKKLDSVIVTVKRYEGNVEILVASDGNMATVYGSMSNYDTDVEDTYLYIADGYKPGAMLYHFRASFVKFDISEIKPLINTADYVVLNLTAHTVQSDIPEDERRYNVYIADSSWSNTLSYNGALNGGLFAGTPAPYDGYQSVSVQPIFSSPVVVAGNKYNTSNIKSAVEAYISSNPDATQISFMLLSDYPSKYIGFYGTAGNETQKPSLEIRYK